jgi:hypothetical protein
MPDQPPAALAETAPVAAPGRPPLEINLLAIAGIVVIALADIAAVSFFSVGAGVVTLISGPTITGLFAIISRSPAP